MRYIQDTAWNKEYLRGEDISNGSRWKCISHASSTWHGIVFTIRRSMKDGTVDLVWEYYLEFE